MQRDVLLSSSTLAVLVLALAMVFVVAGAASQHARLYRVAGLLPDDRAAPFRHHVAAAAFAVLLLTLFWLALGLLSSRQTYPSPAEASQGAEQALSAPAREPLTRIGEMERLGPALSPAWLELPTR